jgi:hypothetical protein
MGLSGSTEIDASPDYTASHLHGYHERDAPPDYTASHLHGYHSESLRSHI